MAPGELGFAPDLALAGLIGHKEWGPFLGMVVPDVWYLPSSGIDRVQ